MIICFSKLGRCCDLNQVPRRTQQTCPQSFDTLKWCRPHLEVEKNASSSQRWLTWSHHTPKMHNDCITYGERYPRTTTNEKHDQTQIICKLLKRIQKFGSKLRPLPAPLNRIICKDYPSTFGTLIEKVMHFLDTPKYLLFSSFILAGQNLTGHMRLNIDVFDVQVGYVRLQQQPGETTKQIKRWLGSVTDAERK